MQYFKMNKNYAGSRMTDRLPHKLYINTGPCNDETLIMPIREAFFFYSLRDDVHRYYMLLFIIILYHTRYNLFGYTHRREQKRARISPRSIGTYIFVRVLSRVHRTRTTARLDLGHIIYRKNLRNPTRYILYFIL